MTEHQDEDQLPTASDPASADSQNSRHAVPGENLPTDLPSPGQTWGKYLIEKQLGEGGQAVVFQAFDQLGPAGHAALKLPRRRIPSEQFQAWIAGEAEPLVKLDHPNIVRVLDAGCVGDTPYVATQLVLGLPIGSYVKNNPPSLRQILDWTIQLADALACAHENGIIHRDLKPRNVIITPEGEPQIIDFGISSLVGAYAPEHETGLSGSPPFMPPEQARADPQADHRVDIFALGAVLKHLMVQTGPYGRKENREDYLQAARDGQVQLLDCDVGPRKRRALARIANRAMDPEPDSRYRNAKEMLRALRRVRTRPRFIAAAVGAVVLAAAVVLGAMALPRAGRPVAPTGPIKASLEIHFQRARQTGVYQVLTADAVPLHSGDRIQIHAEFDRMLVPYLVGVDSEGQVRVLHPDQGAKAKPVRKLQFPPGRDEWLELTPPGGTETIILLASERPVGDVSQLQDQLLSYGRPPVLSGDGLLVVNDKGARFIPGPKERGLGEKTVTVEKGMLARLLEGVPGQWAAVRALAFTHAAQKKPTTDTAPSHE